MTRCHLWKVLKFGFDFIWNSLKFDLVSSASPVAADNESNLIACSTKLRGSAVKPYRMKEEKKLNSISTFLFPAKHYLPTKPPVVINVVGLLVFVKLWWLELPVAGLFVSLVHLPIATLVGRVDVSRGLVEVLVVVSSKETVVEEWLVERAVVFVMYVVKFVC